MALKIVSIAIGIVVIIGLAAVAPDIKRYLHIRSM